eukprot:scaffold1026_cov272-Pinguiococcus_pyrenoidosus.AAC.7
MEIRVSRSRAVCSGYQASEWTSFHGGAGLPQGSSHAAEDLRDPFSSAARVQALEFLIHSECACRRRDAKGSLGTGDASRSRPRPIAKKKNTFTWLNAHPALRGAVSVRFAIASAKPQP